jgi:hypothetical protein
MTDPAKAIIAGLEGVTKKWARQRKAEEREASQRARRYDRMVRVRRVTIKDAAYQVMDKAYMAASANDTLPAHARQIMYQARPDIQEITGRHLDDQYFTQTLLPDYTAERDVRWDIVFDERGHFTEPRGGTIGLGTIAVRDYLKAMAEPRFSDCELSMPGLITAGPSGCFGAVLFIEKEGFLPLFEHVNLAEHYDLAIMSSKGVSNTAARRLVEEICASDDVPLLTLHDFDKAGFSILGTLHQDTRRYSFASPPEIIDLGLRLTDVEELGLDGEEVFDRGSPEAITANLRGNGATKSEIKYLLQQRVELNAMTSDQLVAFVERKLDDNGVKKLIPSTRLLADAYRCAVEEGAEYCGVSPNTLQRHGPKPTRIGGRCVWDRKALDLWLDSLAGIEPALHHLRQGDQPDEGFEQRRAEAEAAWREGRAPKRRRVPVSQNRDGPDPAQGRGRERGVPKLVSERCQSGEEPGDSKS